MRDREREMWTQFVKDREDRKNKQRTKKPRAKKPKPSQEKLEAALDDLTTDKRED